MEVLEKISVQRRELGLLVNQITTLKKKKKEYAKELEIINEAIRLSKLFNDNVSTVFAHESKETLEKINKKSRYNLTKHYKNQKKYMKLVKESGDLLKQIEENLVACDHIIKDTFDSAQSHSLTCRVCYDDYEKMWSNSCGHMFCKDCTKKLKTTTRKCSSCSKVLDSELRAVFL